MNDESQLSINDDIYPAFENVRNDDCLKLYLILPLQHVTVQLLEPILVTQRMAIATVMKASVDNTVKIQVACVAKRDFTMMIPVKIAKVCIAYKFNEHCNNQLTFYECSL